MSTVFTFLALLLIHVNQEHVISTFIQTLGNLFNGNNYRIKINCIKEYQKNFISHFQRYSTCQGCVNNSHTYYDGNFFFRVCSLSLKSHLSHLTGKIESFFTFILRHLTHFCSHCPARWKIYCSLFQYGTLHDLGTDCCSQADSLDVFLVLHDTGLFTWRAVLGVCYHQQVWSWTKSEILMAAHTHTSYPGTVTTSHGVSLYSIIHHHHHRQHHPHHHD